MLVVRCEGEGRNGGSDSERKEKVQCGDAETS